MSQQILYVTLVVNDYDEAIKYYTEVLGFILTADIYQPEQNKRWVTVALPHTAGTQLLLAKATTPEQVDHIGNQTGGRVAFFLHTDDFWGDYQRYRERGLNFLEQPREESYGTVVVFADHYGNKWDLLQLH